MIPEIWSPTETCLMLSFLMLHVTHAVEVFPKCEPEWFGTKCQYKCLCTGLQCDRWGQCTGGSKCKPGYFGPACQYGDIVQLTSLISDVPVWLRDGDDSTCNSDADLLTVEIRFRESVPFSWFRICVNSPGHVNSFDITLNDNISCWNMRSAVVDNKTIDIYCDVDVAVQNLVLTGAGVSFLCSVYVSLGRNMASRESASQSNVHLQGELKAILLTDFADGYNSAYTEGNSSCPHTNTSESSLSWSYSFGAPQAVSSIIWMRGNTAHFSGLILTTYGADGQLVNIFEAERHQNHIYIVRPPPISTVSLRATRNESLSLCEVFIFGEMVCPEDRYGLDCASMCNCADQRQICFTGTGLCAGSCPTGFYGFNCSVPCPDFCVSDVCTPHYGGCIHEVQNLQVVKRAALSNNTGQNYTKGCRRGFFGPNCTARCAKECNGECHLVTGACLKCNKGYYGNNCSLKCSEECLNKHCDAVTGMCIECDVFKYGNMCQFTCGPNCYLFECNRTTGKCFSCAPGYRGDECTLVPWNVTLFIILLFLIPSVIACFFCCELLSAEDGEDRDTVSTDITMQEHSLV